MPTGYWKRWSKRVKVPARSAQWTADCVRHLRRPLRVLHQLQDQYGEERGLFVHANEFLDAIGRTVDTSHP